MNTKENMSLNEFLELPRSSINRVMINNQSNYRIDFE
jgi:hypothetical protein